MLLIKTKTKPNQCRILKREEREVICNRLHMVATSPGVVGYADCSPAKGKDPDPLNEYTGCASKPTNSKAPVLKISRMESPLSLSLLRGPS